MRGGQLYSHEEREQIAPIPPCPAVISTEVEKSHAGMEQPHECHKCSPPRCHFDRSGEISCPSGTSRMAVGDFSTQSLNRAQIPISPYLHAAPLEMTCGAASFTVMEKENKWHRYLPAPLSFRRKPVNLKNLFKTDAPILRRLTAPPAGRALRCSLCVQAMLTQEPGSEVLCRTSA